MLRKVLLLFALLAVPVLGCDMLDVVCHFNKAKKEAENLFNGLDDDVFKTFQNLDPSIQDAFKDAVSFGKLTGEQLKGISADLLAQTKFVSGITPEQLKELAGKIQQMSKVQAEEFAKKLNKDTLSKSLEELGKASDWSANQAGALIDQIKGSDLWGPVETWSNDNFQKIGHLVSGIKAEELVKLDDDLLAETTIAGNLVAEQIGALAQKTNQMAIPEFKKLVAHLPEKELSMALSPMGNVVNWAEDKAKVLYDKLSEENFFGNMTTWTVDNFQLLGDIVGPIVMEGKISHINKDVFKKVGVQVIKAIILSKTFADAVVEVQVEVLGDVVTKVSEIFGGDVEKWTKEAVAFAGPALIAARELSRIPGKVLHDAIPDIINNGFDWKRISVGMAMKFAVRLQESDAYGIISTWSKGRFEQLQDMLPALLSETDIAKIGKAAFKDSVATMRAVADKGLDQNQLKALANKAIEALGPIKGWTKTEIQQIGTIVSGVTPGELKQLNDEAIAAIAPTVTKAMDKSKLDALGDRLNQFTQQAKDSVWGDKLVSLSTESKRALLGCVFTCKQKFVDVVVEANPPAKADDADFPNKLKNEFVEEASQVPPADVKKLFEDKQKDITTFVFRVNTNNIQEVSTRVTEYSKRVDNVGTTALLKVDAVAVEPNAAPPTPELSSVGKVLPSVFSLVLAGVCLFA